MNLKKMTTKLVAILFFTIIGMTAKAQQPGCYMIQDLDGYRKAYKMNYGGALGYKEFYKAYKDSYIDTAYYLVNSLKKFSPIKTGWKITDAIGPAFPYCGKLPADNFSFLRQGIYNNLEADRMFGKGTFGLGVLGGYVNYYVDEAAQLANYKNVVYPAARLDASRATIIKSRPYEVFSLLVGPVATFAIGKLAVDLGIKAGASNSQMATLGANKNVGPSATGVGSQVEIVHRVQQGDQRRWSLGRNLGLKLLYPIADRWKLGLNANAFRADNMYEVIDPVVNTTGENYKLSRTVWNRKQSNFNGGLAIQYIMPTEKRPIYVPLLPLDPPVASAVAVAPSLNSPCDQSFTPATFNNEFNWKSNDNMADKANEMFVFKLYKVPGKEPILVKTQKESTLKLDSPIGSPANVCDTDDYYYTVHSTKGTSFSEMVTCSFKMKSAEAAAAGCSLGAKAESEAVAYAPAKAVYLTRILGKENYTRDIVKYDEGKSCKCPIDTVTTNRTRLVEYFKSYTNEGELGTWPSNLPIPRKASGFIYERRQIANDNGETLPRPVIERYRLDVNRKTREVSLGKRIN